MKHSSKSTAPSTFPIKIAGNYEARSQKISRYNWSQMIPYL